MRAVFGIDFLPDALFYNMEHGLRFELGGDLPMQQPRFLRALERARAVAAAVFADSPTLSIIAVNHDQEHRPGQPKRLFKALRDMGIDWKFSAPSARLEKDEEHLAEFGVDLCTFWRIADGPNSDEVRSTVLWAAVASEMAIHPKASHISRLILADLDRGIALDVYDDRGMDLIAARRPSLEPIYKEFSGWLLDYDREEMRRRFTD